MKLARALLAACLLCALAGCVTTPALAPSDPAVYRPSNPITYPQPY
jgi:type IV pilus biogenesis protein CpaD/CtpE